MERRAPRKHVKNETPGELSPAEALMLRLENLDPVALERLGAEEELRLKGKALRERASRMDAALHVDEDIGQPPRASLAPTPAWTIPAVDEGAGGREPAEWARVVGDSMAGHGLRHGDRVRIDHDVEPAHGDIVFAEIQGIGRALRKLEIIGGVYVLTADPGVKPIAVDDLSQITYHGVVVPRPSR